MGEFDDPGCNDGPPLDVGGVIQYSNYLGLDMGYIACNSFDISIDTKEIRSYKHTSFC